MPPAPPPGQSWVEYFHDPFDSIDTSLWYRYHHTYGDGFQTEDHQRPENLIADGTLKIVSKREQYQGEDFTSGFLSTGARGPHAEPSPTADTFFPRAGYYEMRAKVRQAQGLLPAFWLRHRNGAGVAEVDIMEMFHAQRPGQTDQTLHLDGDTNAYKATTPLQGTGTVPEWHTWGVSILPEGHDVRFRFYLDGAETGTHLAVNPRFWHDYSDPNLWDISLNTHIGGEWVGHPDDPLGYDRYGNRCLQGGSPPNSCNTANLQRAGISNKHPSPHDEVYEIDYVRVWRLEDMPITYQYYDDGTTGATVPGDVLPFTDRYAENDAFATYTTDSIHGSHGAYYSGSETWSFHRILLTGTHHRIRGYVKKSANPTANTILMSARNASSGELAAARVLTGGTVELRRWSPWAALGTTTAWPNGEAWRFEYEITNAGTATEVTLRIWSTDPESTGTPDYTMSGTLGENVDHVSIGNLSGNGMPVVWDSVAFSDGEAIGPISEDPGSQVTITVPITQAVETEESTAVTPVASTPPVIPIDTATSGEVALPVRPRIVVPPSTPETWRVFVAETLTGSIVTEVYPSDLPTFSREICVKGDWSVSLIVDDRANRLIDLRTYATSDRYCWAIVNGETVVQAGPVTSCTYTESSRTLTVSGSGIGHLFEQRVTRDASGDINDISDVSNDLIYENETLDGIMRKLVVNAASSEGPAWALPLIVNQEFEPGTHTRTYHGYDLKSYWDNLIDLSEVENGPEFEFRPHFFNQNGERILAWEFMVGSPLLGNQEYPAVWDYGAALGTIDVDVNASVGPIHRAFSKGAGTEYETLVGFAENSAALYDIGYPATDYVDSDHASVELETTADSHARAIIEEYSTPVEAWSVTVRIDGRTPDGRPVSPNLASWTLGDKPVFRVSGHPWIADQAIRKRVLGFGNDTATTVTLKLGEFPTKL